AADVRPVRRAKTDARRSARRGQGAISGGCADVEGPHRERAHARRSLETWGGGFVVLRVVVGPIASGKSEELMSMAYAYKEAFEDAGEGVVVAAAHRLSVLRGDSVIKSRAGSFIEAKIVESLKELDLQMDPSEPHFIFVDEVHLDRKSTR